ncbi:MAG: arylsulfatase A-like enzyme [Planctomycetota bacterium]|jgi:arylsulfatase A-like enzyme
MHTHLSLSLIVLFSALLSSCGAEDTSNPSRPSILLISIDTLRADHLGCYGYSPYDEPVSPTIDRVAREGSLLTQCFAPRGQTVPSLCSMMTGRYPSSHGVRENGQDFAGRQKTLARRLNALGYETAAFISRLPAAAKGHPARGSKTIVWGDQVFAEAGNSSQQDSDEMVTRETIAFLNDHGEAAADEETRAPFFVWSHYYGVHKPFTPPAPYDRMFADGYEGELVGQLGPAMNQAALQRQRLPEDQHRYALSQYDGEIRFIDDQVSEILSSLASKGLKENTLVIITSDHGEELGDHQGYYFHGNSVYHGVLHIPLIIRWPGNVPAGVQLNALAQNLDLVPTLLEWLGEEIPAEIEGVSLVETIRSSGSLPGPRQYVYSEWQDLIWGIRDGQHSYIFNKDGVHPRKPPFFGRDQGGFRIACDELYDIESDPGELVNHYGTALEAEERLLREVLQFRSREGTVSGWQPLDSEELLENLRSLGYAGTQEGRMDVLFDAEACAR